MGSFRCASKTAWVHAYFVVFDFGTPGCERGSGGRGDKGTWRFGQSAGCSSKPGERAVSPCGSQSTNLRRCLQVDAGVGVALPEMEWRSDAYLSRSSLPIGIRTRREAVIASPRVAFACSLGIVTVSCAVAVRWQLGSSSFYQLLRGEALEFGRVGTGRVGNGVARAPFPERNWLELTFRLLAVVLTTARVP